MPYIVYLGIRHRSLTLFTAANPGIPSGGFVGESKSAILARLSHVPDFQLLSSGLPSDERYRMVKEFMTAHNLSYPVVLKPDVGERGTGVAIARNDRHVSSYLAVAACDTIIQKYVDGFEFGIFYCRYPGVSQGRILSITEKRFPAIVGDGVSTITELVLSDERAVCLADLYLGRLKRPPDEVPVDAEVIPLAELGSHCRGAVFLNGASLETDILRTAVDAIAQSYEGFSIGRFDVRSASIQDLQSGRFEVLELNGVSAEATHIYDPSVSLLEAYRTLYHQWRIAFEIGAINRLAGFDPMPPIEFLRLVLQRTNGPSWLPIGTSDWQAGM